MVGKNNNLKVVRNNLEIHHKTYKAGKRWVYASIAGLAMGAGLIFSGSLNAQADTTTTGTTAENTGSNASTDLQSASNVALSVKASTATSAKTAAVTSDTTDGSGSDAASTAPATSDEQATDSSAASTMQSATSGLNSSVSAASDAGATVTSSNNVVSVAPDQLDSAADSIAADYQSQAAAIDQTTVAQQSDDAAYAVSKSNYDNDVVSIVPQATGGSSTAEWDVDTIKSFFGGGTDEQVSDQAKKVADVNLTKGYTFSSDYSNNSKVPLGTGEDPTWEYDNAFVDPQTGREINVVETVTGYTPAQGTSDSYVQIYTDQIGFTPHNVQDVTTTVQYFYADNGEPASLDVILGFSDIDGNQGIGINNPYVSVMYGSQVEKLADGTFRNTDNATLNSDDQSGQVWILQQGVTETDYTFYVGLNSDGSVNNTQPIQFIGSVSFTLAVPTAPTKTSEKVSYETTTLQTTTNYSVTYQGAGDQTPANVNENVTWTGTYDASTGEYTWVPDQTNVIPDIPGYTTDVSSDFVLGPTTTNPSDQALTVTYTPEAQSTTVTIVDDDNNGAVISTTTVTGVTGGTSAYDVTTDIPEHDVVALNSSATGTIDFTSAGAEPIVVHVEKETTTYTIQWVNNGTVVSTGTISGKYGTATDDGNLSQVLTPVTDAINMLAGTSKEAFIDAYGQAAYDEIAANLAGTTVPTNYYYQLVTSYPLGDEEYALGITLLVNGDQLTTDANGNLVPVDLPATFGDNDETITINYTEPIVNLSRNVNLTTHYVGAGDQTPADNTVNYTSSDSDMNYAEFKIDLGQDDNANDINVNHVLNGTTDTAITPVITPVIAGYTADQAASFTGVANGSSVYQKLTDYATAGNTIDYYNISSDVQTALGLSDQDIADYYEYIKDYYGIYTDPTTGDEYEDGIDITQLTSQVTELNNENENPDLTDSQKQDILAQLKTLMQQAVIGIIDFQYMDINATDTVTYTANPQTITVTYVDDTTGTTMSTAKLTGVTDETGTYTAVFPANYALAAKQSGTVNYQFSSNADENDITIHLVHQTETVTRPYTLTLNTTGISGDDAPAVKTITTNVNYTHDLVNDTYTSQYAGDEDGLTLVDFLNLLNQTDAGISPYDLSLNDLSISAPAVDNYTVTSVTIDGQTFNTDDVTFALQDNHVVITSGSGDSAIALASLLSDYGDGSALSDTWTFNYTHNDVSTKINYVDDDNNEALVSSTPVTGAYDSTVEWTATAPKGYELASNQASSGTVDLNSDDVAAVTVHLVHATRTDTINNTGSVTVIDTDNGATLGSYDNTYDVTGTSDEINNDVTGFNITQGNNDNDTISYAGYNLDDVTYTVTSEEASDGAQSTFVAQIGNGSATITVDIEQGDNSSHTVTKIDQTTGVDVTNTTNGVTQTKHLDWGDPQLDGYDYQEFMTEELGKTVPATVAQFNADNYPLDLDQDSVNTANFNDIIDQMFTDGYSQTTGQLAGSADEQLTYNIAVTLDVSAKAQSTNISFVDNDNSDATVPDKDGANEITVSGVTDGTTNYDVTSEIPAGYALANGQSATGTVTFTANGADPITIQLVHKHEISTVQQTVTTTFVPANSNVNDALLPSDNTQTITWTIDHDEATGIWTATPDVTTINAVTAPIIQDNDTTSYVPEESSTDAKTLTTITGDTNPTASLAGYTQTIKYDAMQVTNTNPQVKSDVPSTSPSAQQYSVKYVDSVTGETVGTSTFIGNSGDIVTANVPEGYVLTPGESSAQTIGDDTTSITFTVTTPKGQDTAGNPQIKTAVPSTSPSTTVQTGTTAPSNGQQEGNVTAENQSNSDTISSAQPQVVSNATGQSDEITTAKQAAKTNDQAKSGKLPQTSDQEDKAATLLGLTSMSMLLTMLGLKRRKRN